MKLQTGFLYVALSLSFAVAASAQGPVVKLDSGQVRGSSSNGVDSFKGVPFAAPPVGPLRWRAPQPAAHWNDIRQATTYAADCMQVPFPSDAAPLGTKPDEDCLYANVWVPTQKPSTKMAVIVWVYGGGSVNGGSSPDVYSGEHFAQEGLVFVSFNYRLGRFGFFAHPGLTAENADGLLGNYGYMDQLAALRWVQRNASAFGGDPNNVTVFGESAGGQSMHMLLGTSLAKGLFERIIIESGSGRGIGRPSLSGSGPDGLPSAEATGLSFAKSVGVEGSGKDAVAKLRQLSAEVIRGDLNMATSRTNIYSGAMIDGKIILGTQVEEYLSGSSAEVPIMIGGNSADAGTAPGDTIDALFSTFGQDAAEAKNVYMSGTEKSLAALRGQVGRDRAQLEPARFVARIYAARGLPAYEFRYSYVATSKRSEWASGVPHATEIPFVFDTVRAKYGTALTDSDEAISRQTLKYWANFAKTGNPNGQGLPNWPKYDAQNDTLMNFTIDGPVAQSDPWQKRLDMAEKYSNRIPLATKPSNR